MKNPKKLTRAQKEKLSKKGFDATEYVLITEDTNTFTVQKKSKLGTKNGLLVFHK